MTSKQALTYFQLPWTQTRNKANKVTLGMVRYRARQKKTNKMLSETFVV